MMKLMAYFIMNIGPAQLSFANNILPSNFKNSSQFQSNFDITNLLRLTVDPDNRLRENCCPAGTVKALMFTVVHATAAVTSLYVEAHEHIDDEKSEKMTCQTGS